MPSSRSGSEPSVPGRALPLPPILEALEAWRSDPTEATVEALAAVIGILSSELDLQVSRLQVFAPPLPELDLRLSSAAAGREVVLGMPGDGAPIGSLRVDGNPARTGELARALELAVSGVHARARADRADRQLRSLDEAVRGISEVLDIDLVLQTIVDRVRDLAQAEYAALGIVDGDGAIERFITSGISEETRAHIGDLPRGRGLLGLIIRDNRSYRIRDIGAHPESYGFPPHHPEMGSFLGMPVTSRGRAVGRLYLTNKLGAAEFSEDDQALVEMFALHAGIAIENARLHDQVRRLAVVDERDRISRDLHDSVIQSIYAQTLALDDVLDLVDEDREEARRRVDDAIDALHAVIRDIRNFIFGLRPVLLEGGDLASGLDHLSTELRRSSGVEVSVSVEDETGVVGDVAIEVVAELMAITREALSNVARHASAERASVILVAGAEEVRVEIADDGRGFDAHRTVARGHHGLANMRARAEAMSGTFDVRSAPAGGTRIIVTVPRRRAQADGGEER
jgi:signal transduction histidine kinase